MLKRSLSVVICIALLLASLSGCIEIRQYARESAWQTKTPGLPGTDDLPTLPPPSNEADIIPLDVFTSYYEYEGPDISDDGEMILYRHIQGPMDEIIAENWRTGERTAVEWPQEARGIPYYLWAPDGENVLFFVDDMGDENFGLYTSNIKTGETKTVISGGDNDCGYVSDNPENDKEIYVTIFDFGREVYDLYLLNYETGSKTLVLKNPGDITGYYFDDNGALTLVSTSDSNAGKHILLKTGSGGGTEYLEGDWKEILSWGYEDADTSGIRYIMRDGKRLVYSDTSKSDTAAYYYYDIATGGSTEIFNDPDYDASSSWVDLELQKVTAVTVYGQKTEWHVLDDSFQDDYDVLKSAGDEFSIYDSSEQDEYWVVAYTSDIREKDYYMYDMAAKELKFLYNAQPELLGYEFAPMEPFSYTTGDGLEIEGYATFPLGIDKKNLPTVLLVHGGPWSRDSWGYSQEVQFLANRGYLVLQVNFRGSSGYGKKFLKAGDMQWGGLMHQDILDALDYAVGEGWTDPERVGVYGASYGGYEALVSAAFSSDVFACAVDAFGPSSLITLVESIPPQWKVERESFIRAVGDPEKDAEFMKSRSPLYFAKDMKIPLLIAQGENDVRVTQQQSDQMVEALEDAGIPVKYLLFDDTGHGLGSKEDKITFYSALEEFFAENLGGKVEK